MTDPDTRTIGIIGLGLKGTGLGKRLVARVAVRLAAIGGLLFDDLELGLMPVASLSVAQDSLGGAYTPTLAGDGLDHTGLQRRP